MTRLPRGQHQRPPRVISCGPFAGAISWLTKSLKARLVASERPAGLPQASIRKSHVHGSGGFPVPISTSLMDSRHLLIELSGVRALAPTLSVLPAPRPPRGARQEALHQGGQGTVGSSLNVNNVITPDIIFKKAPTSQTMARCFLYRR